MTESLDDHDAIEQEDSGLPIVPSESPEALFGDYSVLSPGVEIVLEGRPVSAPAPD
jgi:hypothetical protein